MLRVILNWWIPKNFEWKAVTIEDHTKGNNSLHLALLSYYSLPSPPLSPPPCPPTPFPPHLPILREETATSLMWSQLCGWRSVKSQYTNNKKSHVFLFYKQLALMVHMGWIACLHVGTVHKAMSVIRSMVHALVDASLALIIWILFARNVSSIWLIILTAMKINRDNFKIVLTVVAMITTTSTAAAT